MLYQQSGYGKLIRQETCFKLKLVKHLEKIKGLKTKTKNNTKEKMKGFLKFYYLLREEELLTKIEKIVY